jgi:hypothetical protein
MSWCQDYNDRNGGSGATQRNYRSIAAGVAVDGFAIRVVGISRSILNKDCLGKSKPCLLVRRTELHNKPKGLLGFRFFSCPEKTRR